MCTICVSHRFPLPQLCTPAWLGLSRPILQELSQCSTDVSLSLSPSLSLPWPLNQTRTNTHYRNTGKSWDLATGYSCEALKTWKLSLSCHSVHSGPSLCLGGKNTHRRSGFVMITAALSLFLSLCLFLTFFPSWPAYSFNYHEVISLSLPLSFTHV